MEEILPAARLLSQATAVTPSDYEHAKAVFLEHVQSAGAAAENLSKQACHTAVATRSNSVPVAHSMGIGSASAQ